MPAVRRLSFDLFLAGLFFAFSSRGAFAVRPLFPNPAYQVGEYPASIVTGDFDRDGRLDLAVTNSGTSDISILIGVEGGAFAPERRFATGTAPNSVVVGDFNKDGIPDLAVAMV